MFAAPQNLCDLSDIISNNSHRPESYFTINSVINPSHSIQSLQLSEKLLRFFVDKVAAVRTRITPPVPVYSSAVFNHFEPVSLGTLAEVVSHLKPSVSHLDIIPTRLFKDLVDTLGPSVLSIINISLLTGAAPADFKHATVQPVLKKRLICKLPLVSKDLEEMVFLQLQAFRIRTSATLDSFKTRLKTHL